MNDGSDIIKSILDSLPTAPGVYQMLDKKGNIIYVGKAKNLLNRLTSYLRPADNKTQLMLFSLNEVKYTITQNEVEALILESKLIKKHQPKFNILLKDGKLFPFIKLRVDHQYPQLVKYRGNNLVEGRFFGPFPSSQELDSTLEQLQKIFKLRSCSDNYFANRTRPCLQYQIKRCLAPCVNKISHENYKAVVKEVVDFLRGKSKNLQQELNDKMLEYSNNMEFEKAALIRDKIKALSYVQLKGGIVDSGLSDVDVITISDDKNIYAIQVTIYRGGQNCGSKTYMPTNTEHQHIEDILYSFIEQFYIDNIPAKEIFINIELNEEQTSLDVIRKLHNVKCRMSLPKSTIPKQLITNSIENAKAYLTEYNKNLVKHQQMFGEIKELFTLPDIPNRIEIYDNSHIMGSDAVGVMVVSTNKGFAKKEYRSFNIIGDGSSSKGDDYQMLREVLTRRLLRIKLNKENTKPDLLIIDGGAGHLTIVAKVMNDLEINIPFVCMSKGVMRNSGLEKFHTLNRPEFSLDKNLPIMKYLQILRDEAHNYAIRVHRNKRNKKIRNSDLENIPNIGQKRKQILISYFGSLRNVRDATIEELTKVPNISNKVAEQIFNYFHLK